MLVVFLLFAATVSIPVSAEDSTAESVADSSADANADPPPATETPNFAKMRVKQLKAFLAERGVECKACAEKEHYVELCEESKDLPLAPKEEKPKVEVPPEDVMDNEEIQRIMRQMRGEDEETDPEKKKILDRIKKKGVSFSGGAGMDLEQLKNLEKAMTGGGIGGEL